MRRKRFLISLIILLTVALGISFPQIFHKNTGKSISYGKVNSGSLINAYKVPFRGDNYKFFSYFSYYILGRGYVHSDVYKTVVNAYADCEKELPAYKFGIMECSKNNGGKMAPHRTHQNGLSIDFMTPLAKNGKQKRAYDRFGIFKYVQNFDSKGRLNMSKNVHIDFETMARHILILDNEARKNGLRIKKVIFKINLKDDLFKTKSGIELKQRGIYFAKHLPEMIDKLHDDHYHIDFETVN